jgi:hypothetical protein
VGKFGASASGKAYEITENKTIIDSVGHMGYGAAEVLRCTGGRVKISKMRFAGTLVGVYAPTYEVLIQYTDAVGCTYGYFTETRFTNLSEVYASGGTYGINYQFASGNGPGSADNSGVHIYQSGTGVRVSSAPSINLYFTSIAVVDCTSHGLDIRGGTQVNLDSCFIDNNGGYGIWLDSDAANTYLGMSGANELVVSNNTTGGIAGLAKSVVKLGSVTGTGNGTYGLELQFGSSAIITSATSLTGSSGDATINGGNTVLDWSTDFAANGDSVTNVDSHSSIERKD